MRRHSGWIFLGLLIAASAYAGTISRGTKPYGGTAFQDGEVLAAAEINTDLDNIYNEFNGSISAANLAADSVGASEVAANSVASVDIIAGEIVDSDVNASADIDPGKIGDYSANAGEADNQTSPGTTGSESLATTLEGELERLRYAINRIAHGSSSTSAAKSWIDPPMRGKNVITHGGFDLTDGTGSVASTTVAQGWTNLNTATIAYIDPTDVSEGEGVAMRTTATGSTDEGASQSLANLRASTPYLFIARVKPTAGDTCDLQVTGGAATVTDTSAGSGSYETLAVIATTNSTPSALLVRLESNADTDVCVWDNVGAWPLLEDPVPSPGIADCFDTDSTLTSDYGSASMVAVPGLSCAVVPPGPGYMVEIDADVLYDNDCAQAIGLEVDLLENGTAVAFAISSLGEVDQDGAGVIKDNGSTRLHFRRMNPTPGTTLTYTLQARADNCGDVFSNDQDDDTVTTQTPYSMLHVKLVPVN